MNKVSLGRRERGALSKELAEEHREEEDEARGQTGAMSPDGQPRKNA